MQPTRIAEIALGLFGVVLLVGWIALIVFMFTRGEVETPVVLLGVTALGLFVIQRNAAATA